MLKVTDDITLDDAQEIESAVILGEEHPELKKKKGNPCDPLIWGKMFSCDERKKVIKIAAELWGEDKKLKMADELMACIALETGGKFTPDVTKGDGIGLIQYTGTAVDDMNLQGYNNGKKLTKTMLGNMTILEQLDYVKLYFDMHQKHYKRKISDALDMYLCILCPAAVGKDDSFVCYSIEKDAKKGKDHYKKNKSIDGEYYYEKKNLVLKNKADGKITRGELKPRLQMWTAKGVIKKNKCKTDTSTCKYGTSKGDYKESACPDCGQVHVDLRDKLTFKSQAAGSTNCGTIAKNIIEQLNVSCEGSGEAGVYYQLAIENNEHTELNFNIAKSKDAIKYLDTALEKGYPVRVGVNHTLRKDKTKNKDINEKTTDHFVVIVGKKCINGVIHYIYWDVATSRGESTEWLFELKDGYKLTSDNTYKSDRKYTATQIARVTKMNRSTLVKIFSVLLLFFISSCKNVNTNNIFDNRTLVEVKQDSFGNLYNYVPCDISALKFRFMEDQIYVLYHMDDFPNMSIAKITHDKDTVKYSTDPLYNEGNGKDFKFYKRDSITWVETAYNSILVDSVYAQTLAIIKQPCIECWEKYDCDEWARQEKEEKQQNQINNQIEQLKNNQSISSKWIGEYTHDNDAEGSTAGGNSTLSTSTYQIKKDSVIYTRYGYMSDVKDLYLGKEVEDTLFLYTYKMLNGSKSIFPNKHIEKLYRKNNSLYILKHDNEIKLKKTKQN
jgi:hypothetical protein